MFWPRLPLSLAALTAWNSSNKFPEKENVFADCNLDSEQPVERDDAATLIDDDDGEEIIPADDHFTQRSILLSPNTEPRTWFARLKASLAEFVKPKDSETEVDEFVPNYRLGPIFSGAIIPLAILLEIPGLTELWYIRTLGNNIVERRLNPMILNVGLGISMACAVAANVALIVRFLERRVKQMTILCITFLTIHDIINTIAVTTFGVEHRFDDGFTYGQSFWVTVCATIVSTFTNIILIFDLIQTPSFDSSGSGLTRKQRSLVIIVMVFLTYIAFGALIHCILEDLPFIDSLYFTVCTIETIGFGDISPSTTGGRVFTCVYAAIGILILALAIDLTRDTVLEALEVSYRKRVRAYQEQKRNAAWRARVSRRWLEGVEWRLKAAGVPVWVDDDPMQSACFSAKLWKVVNVIPRLWDGGGADGHDGRYLGAVRHPHGMHLNLEGLTGEQLEAAAMEAGVPLSTLLPPSFWKQKGNPASRKVTPIPESNQVSNPDDMPLTYVGLGQMAARLTSFALAVNRSVFRGAGAAFSIRSGWSDATVLARQPYRKSLTQQYDDFRAAMKTEERRAFYARLVVAWTLFLVFWMTGSAIFMRTEGWSFGIAMYFCFIAFSSIGFGDFSPKSPAGRSIFVVWALLGVGTMTILVSVLSEAYSSQYKSAIHAGLLDRAVKRYRARGRAGVARKPANRLFPSSPNIVQCPAQPVKNESTTAMLQSHQRAKRHLEALPSEILSHAKSFHEHMQYFVGSPPARDAADALMPVDLRVLLDDIAGGDGRVRRELLQDPYARHTLFILSIERCLRIMIDSAETALDAMEEREYLLGLHSTQAGQELAPGLLAVPSTQSSVSVKALDL